LVEVDSTDVCGKIAGLVDADASSVVDVNETFLRTAVSCRAVDARLAASTSLCDVADVS